MRLFKLFFFVSTIFLLHAQFVCHQTVFSLFPTDVGEKKSGAQPLAYENGSATLNSTESEPVSWSSPMVWLL